MNIKRTLKNIGIGLTLVGSGVAIDQALVAKRFGELEKNLQAQIQQKVDLGKPIVAELYQSPNGDQFYVIRLGANPNERLDPHNFEIYLDSLRNRYFPEKKNNNQ